MKFEMGRADFLVLPESRDGGNNKKYYDFFREDNGFRHISSYCFNAF